MRAQGCVPVRCVLMLSASPLPHACMEVDTTAGADDGGCFYSLGAMLKVCVLPLSMSTTPSLNSVQDTHTQSSMLKVT